MNDYIYVNGAFLPSTEATISVQDRAFRFGDGAFETIAIHNGMPYQWEFHQKRLAESLTALRIHMAEDWSAPLTKICKKNRLDSGFVRITVSRGVGSQGYRPTKTIPTIVMETIARNPQPTPPAKLHMSQWRKASATQFPAGSKLNALGTNSTLALLDATDHGADEALQLNQYGQLSEASSGNLFWIKGDTLFTPALSCDCLNGSTRDAVIRTSPLPVEQVTTEPDALSDADAVFITNCNWGVRAVSSLSPNGYSWSSEHTALTALRDLYQQDIEAQCGK